MANNKKSNTLIHDTICLFLITLIAGVLLGGVYQITKNTIAQREEDAKKEAYEAVYKDGTFKADKDVESKLAEFQKKLTAGEIKTASGADLSDVEILEVLKVEEGGYVATCTGKGYGGAVKLALGIDAEGTVKGIQITDCSNETPGLGQNSSSAEWNGQYLNMNTSQEITVVKDGTGSQKDGKINAISGATITSSAVTRAVNSVLLFVASLSE
ncbi:MAG: RnfABCDGE type electron transport complex subunit G [Butyribacter sp.]|nr:RnfABCDGE type electron transport complex subunit G [bacterium]MDY3854616.1 RnfABCDGE type electron transport complex subunit G [Butyribacter sp.]